MVQFIGTLKNENSLGDTLTALDKLFANTAKSQEKKRVQDMISYVNTAKTPEEAKQKLAEFQRLQEMKKGKQNILSSLFNPNAATNDFSTPELQLGLDNVAKTQDQKYQTDLQLIQENLKNAQFQNSPKYQDAVITGLTNRNRLTGAQATGVEQDNDLNSALKNAKVAIANAQSRTAGAQATVAENSASQPNLDLDNQIKLLQTKKQEQEVNYILEQAKKLGIENSDEMQALNKLYIQSKAYENYNKANTNEALNAQRIASANKANQETDFIKQAAIDAALKPYANGFWSKQTKQADTERLYNQLAAQNGYANMSDQDKVKFDTTFEMKAKEYDLEWTQPQSTQTEDLNQIITGKQSNKVTTDKDAVNIANELSKVGSNQVGTPTDSNVIGGTPIKQQVNNPYAHYTKDQLQFNGKDLTGDVALLDKIDDDGLVPTEIADKVRKAIDRGVSPAQIVATPQIQELLQAHKK